MLGSAFTRHVGSLTLGAALGFAMRVAVRTFQQDVEIAALRSQVREASRAGEIVARAARRTPEPDPVTRPSFRLIPGGPDAEVPPDLPPAKDLLPEVSLAKFRDALLELQARPPRQHNHDRCRALKAEITAWTPEDSPPSNVVPFLRRPGPDAPVVILWRSPT